MVLYLGTTLAMSAVWGLVVWWLGENPFMGFTVATFTYAGTITIGCFMGILRHTKDIPEGVTNLYQNLPEVTTIKMHIRFSRDADHKFPLYYVCEAKDK
jgi:hypothetical protein